MNGSQLVVTGNVTRDPECRFTPGGDAVVDVSVASNRSYKVGDDWEEETTFYKAVFWGQYAENIADSIGKGDNVIVTGQLELETWENDDGDEKTNLKIRGDEIGVLLKWATVGSIERVTSKKGGDKKSGGRSGGSKGSGRSSRSGGRNNSRNTGRDGGGGREYSKDEEPF